MTIPGLVAATTMFGLFLAAIGMLARAGRLRPNSLVGNRTPAVMASAQSWRAGHRAGSPWMVLAGLATVGYAGLLWVLAAGGDANPRRFEIGYVLALLGCMFFSVWVATRASRAVD